MLHADLLNLPARFETELRRTLASVASDGPATGVSEGDVSLLSIKAGSVVVDTIVRVPTLDAAARLVEQLSCCAASLFESLFPLTQVGFIASRSVCCCVSAFAAVSSYIAIVFMVSHPAAPHQYCCVGALDAP